MKNRIEQPRIPPVKFNAVWMYYLKAKLITSTIAKMIEDIIAVVFDNLSALSYGLKIAMIFLRMTMM